MRKLDSDIQPKVQAFVKEALSNKYNVNIQCKAINTKYIKQQFFFNLCIQKMQFASFIFLALKTVEKNKGAVHVRDEIIAL